MSTLQPNGDESQSQNSPVFQSPEGGLILIRTTQQDRVCPNPDLPFIKGFNSDQKTVMFLKPSCKRWECPVCGEKNAYKARLRAIQGYEHFLEQNRRFDFLTLTPHEKLTARASIPVMASAWNKLNRRIKREAQHSDYFLIPEMHRSGKIHFHALIDAELPRRWWKNNGRECGMGYQNDLQEVHEIGGVGGYLTKYLAKMLQSSNFPSGFRRIRTSQSWPQVPAMERPIGWEFKPLGKNDSRESQATGYQKAGWTVIFADSVAGWNFIEDFG